MFIFNKFEIHHLTTKKEMNVNIFNEANSNFWLSILGSLSGAFLSGIVAFLIFYSEYFTLIGASKFIATSASEFTANGASKNLFLRTKKS